MTHRETEPYACMQEGTLKESQMYAVTSLDPYDSSLVIFSRHDTRPYVCMQEGTLKESRMYAVTSLDHHSSSSSVIMTHHDSPRQSTACMHAGKDTEGESDVCSGVG